jgi:hypothetical protein
MSKTPMTGKAAARIQSATTKSQGQPTKGSFVARAQSAAANNAAAGTARQSGGK